MQKIIRATNRAKTQSQRKMAAENAKNIKINRKVRLDQEKARSQDIRSSIHAARIARREDWIMGPLAPRRDVGDMKDTYGTVSIRQLRGVEKPEGKRKDWCIREGDRVAITGAKQRDRGKIGTVKTVNEKSEECAVQGCNLVCSFSSKVFFRWRHYGI